MISVYPISIRILDDHYSAVEQGNKVRGVELRKSFGAWHGVSQTLNLATVALVAGALVVAAWQSPPEQPHTD
jgi:hypothetical protein